MLDIETLSGIILCMSPANERQPDNVMPSLTGWAHTQNYHHFVNSSSGHKLGA